MLAEKMLGVYASCEANVAIAFAAIFLVDVCSWRPTFHANHLLMSPCLMSRFSFLFYFKGEKQIKDKKK